jgi:hypothetical protein
MENKNAKPWYKVWWIWLIIVVVIFIIGSIASDNKNSSNKKSDKTVKVTKGKTVAKKDDSSTLNKEYKVGQTLDYKGYKIVVNDVKYFDGDDINTPKQGNKYVAIKVTITNDTNDKQDYNSFDFKLSANGNATDLDEIISNDTYENNKLDSGTLSKGASASGYLIGQANPNAKLKLQYQPSFFDDHTVDIDLN